MVYRPQRGKGWGEGEGRASCSGARGCISSARSLCEWMQFQYAGGSCRCAPIASTGYTGESTCGPAGVGARSTARLFASDADSCIVPYHAPWAPAYLSVEQQPILLLGLASRKQGKLLEAQSIHAKQKTTPPRCGILGVSELFSRGDLPCVRRK